MLQRLNTRPQARPNVQPRPTRQNTKQTQFSGLYKITIKNVENSKKGLQDFFKIDKEGINHILQDVMEKYDCKFSFFKKPPSQEEIKQARNLPETLGIIEQKGKWFIAGVSDKEKIDFHNFCTDANNKKLSLEKQLSKFFIEQKNRAKTPINKIKQTLSKN